MVSFLSRKANGRRSPVLAGNVQKSRLFTTAGPVLGKILSGQHGRYITSRAEPLSSSDLDRFFPDNTVGECKKRLQFSRCSPY